MLCFNESPLKATLYVGLEEGGVDRPPSQMLLAFSKKSASSWTVQAEALAKFWTPSMTIFANQASKLLLGSLKKRHPGLGRQLDVNHQPLRSSLLSCDVQSHEAPASMRVFMSIARESLLNSSSDLA